jgi:hypothetical protein
MKWSPEQDAELKRLWPDASASQIAKKMGTTRNAVIGRIHRLEGGYPQYESALRRARAVEAKKRRAARRAEELIIINAMKDRLSSGHCRDRAILLACEAGARQRVIAKECGISYQRVQQILVREKESILERRESH